MAATIPISRAASIQAPTSTTTGPAIQQVNATQLKFQNFDSELTQLISGLKSNMKRDADDAHTNSDDDKLLLSQDNDVEPLALTPTIKSSDEVVSVNDSNGQQQQQQQQLTSSDESATQNAVNLNKPLADIVVDLNEIRPHDEYAPRCIMDEKSGGLKIMLNFTKDRPRADVVVLVITTTNQNSLPIKNFQFEASVPKVIEQDYYMIALFLMQIN